MSLLDHLAELRTRIFVALGAWVVAAGAAFGFQKPILEWLKAPLPPDIPLISTELLEPLIASMQIAAFSGLVIASPIIVSQLWGFIAPGLYKEERRWAVPFILLSTLAFAAGVAFSYYIVLPFALPVILGFLPNSEITTFIRIGNYIGRLILYLGVFGVLFEMPVLGFLLARLGLLRAQFMTQYRRYAIVIGCVVAALITPTPDPVNFGLVAVPLIVLYEVSILVVRISQKRVTDGRENPEPTSPN